MKDYTLYQVDAFTQERFKGNPAGVVPNADGLSDTQMQAIARELNNSETAFLLPPDDTNCDGVIRYFTPSTEVPVCGHATIAAMYVKTIEENLAPCELKMKTGVGILPFAVEKDTAGILIRMTQGAIEIQPPLSQHHQQELLAHLGLQQDDLDERCPIQVASTGHSKVMIGINSRDTLNNLHPVMSQLSQLSKSIGCNGYFVFTLDSDDPEILTHGRMFAPAIGINEDPVTGNANGPLGAYLVHNKIIKIEGGHFTFLGKQGEAIRREGVIEVQVFIENGTPQQVKIAGRAVQVFQTSIQI